MQAHSYYFLEMQTKKQINATKIFLNVYYYDVGHYPSTTQGLEVLLKRPTGPDGYKWKGPYLRINKKIPTDAWGNQLHYQCPGLYNPDSYDLWSYGADNKKGGTNKNSDIGNW
jgi:general secretion pathway protein G